MRINYKNASIKIIPEVYEPSEDSFLLAEAGLSEIRDEERIIEVGCGSGFISAVIKANRNVKIIGIDINPHAVKCTKENGIEVIRGDLLSCIKGRFDAIIFNPPYLPTKEEERVEGWINTALDGGYDGRRIIFRFLEDAGNHLVKNGRIMMVLSSLTGIEEVKARMKSLGFEVEEKAQESFMFEKLIVLVATKI